MKTLIFTLILFFSASLAVSAQEDGTGTGQGTGQGSGRGSGIGSGRGSDCVGAGCAGSTGSAEKKAVKPPRNSALKMISKPRHTYTDAARANNVQGVVRLQVVFKKDATIGKIKVIQGLPDGLTQQAIDAANKIRFEPARKNGKPVTVTKTVEYTFTIY